jgi:RimJ/RimL family protein N-acetyltransferase
MTLLERRPDEIVRESRPATLETPRLILRAPHPNDANAIAVLANDRRVAENTARLPHPYTPADARAFMAQTDGDNSEVVFFVTLRNHTLIGACGIAALDGKHPEIGYWLGVPHWGKGYATEAARALIDHAFTELDYETLHAGARVSNPTSRRVLEKCGFQWIGVKLMRVRAMASAAPVDRFRLDRRLWASLKSWGTVARLAPPI